MNILRNNQNEALESFENYYYNESNTRGILSMCCGSGKTRTFYEILKNCINLHNEDFFIYATSRILLVKGIVQEIIEWMYIEKLEIDILIKVSDFKISEIKTDIIKKNYKNNNFDKDKFNEYFNLIKKNNIKLLENDDIIDILKARYILENKRILIITSYQSIIDIINTISSYNNTENVNKKITPNLLTLDEAHNLVSNNNDLKIAKKILDENEDVYFYPDKYLFMTATPLKIIKRNQKDSYTDNNIIYSMANENIYGKVFYEYTFYEGMRDNYILDFDVVYLSDFDSNEDNDVKKAFDDLKFIDDKKEQQQIYFDIVAQYLLKTINIYKLKHTLVFLSNQTKAKCLCDILNKHIKINKLNNKVGYYISDTKDQNKKEKELNKKEFETYDGISKILLSVDIFNEGIDIPICDSILFAEERNSETVIVQNIGRALRKYNNTNFIKDKAYIILPTKIYIINNNNESAFSSKFKKIREVCDILREPPEQNNPRYYTRKTKGESKNFKNENDDENINEKSGLVDNIINIDENDYNKNTDNFTDLDKHNNISNTIFNSLEIQSTNEKLSNIKLDVLKTIVQKSKINNLFNLIEFTKNNYAIDKPHLYYKNDWLCYGDFLFNKVYTYNEAIDIIKSLNLDNINSPKEWLTYYNNIINLALNNDCSNDELNIIDKIIYIPYDPKTYYLNEWKTNDNEDIGWNKFLGKSLNDVIGVEISTTSSSYSINASNNLKNLINQDKDKVKKLIKNEWQTYDELQIDLNPLKKYIDNYFNIDCKIDVRFRLTNTYSLNSHTLNIKINNISEPIIVINFNYNCKYDNNIFNINKLKIQKINRNEEFVIQNEDIRNIIDDIKNELKLYVDNYKKKNL
jgi:superfamily II DNA or RNA helicase